jgi:hypothetical protein
LVTLLFLALILMGGEPANDPASRQVAAPSEAIDVADVPPPADRPAIPPPTPRKSETADPEPRPLDTPAADPEPTETTDATPAEPMPSNAPPGPEPVPPAPDAAPNANLPFGPFVAASPVEAVQKMSKIFGATKVAKLVVRGGEELDIDRSLLVQLMSMGESPKPPSVYVFSQGNVTAAVIAPITDVNALAEKINFGKVVSVDADDLKVAVTLDRTLFGDSPAGRPSSDTTADAPASSNPLDRTLAKLKSSDDSAIRAGLQQLETMPVDDSLRQVVTAALIDVIDREEGFAWRDAFEPLARWHNAESIPAIVKLIEHDSSFVRSQTYEFLGTFQDERVASACVERFREDRMEAGKALRAMGPVAETAVARLLRDSDTMIQSDACRILGEIGTKKSLRRLVPLTKERNPIVRNSAERAVEKIRAKD